MKFVLISSLTTFIAITGAHPFMSPQSPAHLRGRQTNDVQFETRSHSGKMTYYTPDQGSCGVTSSSSDMVVAISTSMYGSYANPNSSPMCQKTVAIDCNGKTIKAAVTDKCMGCGADDIDVSPAVFSQCGDLALGTMTVTWNVI